MLERVMQLAQRRGLSVSEYMRRFDPATDSPREFNEKTPASTGVDIVIKSKPRKKENHLPLILVILASLILVFILLKSKK